MSISLRYYQREAIDAVYRWLPLNDGNPVICIPTGGGKTPIIATIANDAVTQWGGRVVVLAHVKELLEQTALSIARMYPNLWTGVYSAGLNSRDSRPPVVVAGIQSVAGKVSELGPRDLVIIDEAHMLPPSGYGRYRQFITDMLGLAPHCRVVGLTATPYRTSSGWLCGQDEIFNEICYEIGVKRLIEDGYLSKLVAKEGQAIDTSKLHVRNGEFVESEVAELMDPVIYPACQRIVEMTVNRHSVLIFAANVAHAEKVQHILSEMTGQRVGLITGESIDFDRQRNIRDFKNQTLKYLVNVNVLTTGFDAPNVDCVAALRPTVSPGLWYQMVGRGFRIDTSKTDCLVLDFGNNTVRHGPIDCIQPRGKKDTDGDAPQKVCPSCKLFVHASVMICPECGYEWIQEEKPKHETRPSDLPILSTPAVEEELEVFDTKYTIHRPRGSNAGKPDSLKVSYKLAQGNIDGLEISEWVCFDHTGFARSKAEQWWAARSNDPCPPSVSRAFEAAIGGALAPTLKIFTELKMTDKWPRIVRYEIGPKPDAVDSVDVACETCGKLNRFGDTQCCECGSLLKSEGFDFPHAEQPAMADEEMPF